MSSLICQGLLAELNVHFLKIYLCTLGTEYGLEHIVFAYYFSLKSTGSVF